MTPEDAALRIRDIQAKINERAQESEIAATHYSIQMQTHMLACKIGDARGIEASREAVHAAIDTMMDCGQTMHELQREMHNVMINYESL